MHIETTVEKLKNAVNRVQKVSSKNLSLPVLENILLSSESNSLTMRSTNLHVGVEVTVAVKEVVAGTALVNLDIFSKIIGSLSSEDKIVLKIEEQTLLIQTETSHMDIKLFPDQDFPTLPRIEDGQEIELPMKTFIEGVEKVHYAASQSDIKPEIASVYIYPDGKNLIFVATDSFRLAEKKIVTDTDLDFEGIIIPIKNIAECVKIFQGIEDRVSVVIGKNQISIQSEDIYFTSRIVDGNYPDYKQIIPTESNIQSILLKSDLVDALRLVNVFSDTFNQISFSVQKDSGSVSLHTRNTDVGENKTTIDAAITGGDIDMFLNHRYVSDVLSVVQVDSVSFSFTEKNKPCVVSAVGDESFLYLIMPMNR